MLSMDFFKGEVILINKPISWTSFDVVNKMRIALKEQSPANKNLKVGHAGTLDPLATGLLIVCTGGFTKQIEKFQQMEKEYTGTFFLGATTPSFDLETKPDREFEISNISEAMILKAAKKFIGKIQQVPPAHSAIKIQGKRAYKKARRGEDFVIPAREVEIKEFKITGMNLPFVDFRVVCSKGTYIRSLANDFGKALDAGAYLHSLCRTRIGSLKLEDALPLKEFIENLKSEIAG